MCARASRINFRTYVVCDLFCMTASLSRCVEASPTFDDFERENPTLANGLKLATSCCFDSDSGHAVRRTCNLSHAISARTISLLSICVALMLSLFVIYTL